MTKSEITSFLSDKPKLMQENRAKIEEYARMIGGANFLEEDFHAAMVLFVLRKWESESPNGVIAVDAELAALLGGFDA